MNDLVTIAVLRTPEGVYSVTKERREAPEPHVVVKVQLGGKVRHTARYGAQETTTAILRDLTSAGVYPAWGFRKGK